MPIAVTTITDTFGNDWVLDGTNGVWEGQGKKGFHAPTFQHYRDESPAVAGAFWRGVRTLPRDLFIPVVITRQNRDDVLELRRQLIRALNPMNGECVVSSAWPDGSVRRIRCRYVEGMDAGEQGPGNMGVTAMRYGLRFMADDPYMYGDEIVTTWSLAPQTRTELPMPGADGMYEVVSSPLLGGGGVTIFNPGDVDAYPTWSFTGPFTQIVATNATTGKSFTIDYTAASGSNRLDLVTDPGTSYLVDESGQNRWNTLTAGYKLWPLRGGDNEINISFAGATAASLATLTYMPFYGGD